MGVDAGVQSTLGSLSEWGLMDNYLFLGVNTSIGMREMAIFFSEP